MGSVCSDDNTDKHYEGGKLSSRKNGRTKLSNFDTNTLYTKSKSTKDQEPEQTQKDTEI